MWSDALIPAPNKRAADHHNTPTDEAKDILPIDLIRPANGAWCKVEEIYNRLASSDRQLGDSSVRIREDRDR
jgi:hypothetical protein